MSKSLLVILVATLILGSALGCLGCPLTSLLARAPTPVSTPTRTPKPTFTPAPAATDTLIPTNTPDVPPPTDTPPLSPTSVPTPTPIPQPEATVATQTLNVRSGPGTNYGRVRQVKEGERLKVIGRTKASDWLKIVTGDGQEGWVAAEFVTVNADLGPVPVAVAQAPPPPTPQPKPPTPTPVPPTPTSPPQPTAPPKPQFQYTPTGWYGAYNPGLTRFLGDIEDASGNPVNGVFVKAVCGSFSTISYPSGPVGWGPQNESNQWPPGFYDITVSNKPVPCVWTLQVVDTDDRETVKAELSEAVPVEVTNEESVITANWKKNW